MTPKRGVRFLETPPPPTQQWNVPSFEQQHDEQLFENPPSPNERVLTPIWDQPKVAESSLPTSSASSGKLSTPKRPTLITKAWSPISTVSEVTDAPSPFPFRRQVKDSAPSPSSSSIQTVDMLNLEYIQTCDTPLQLGRVIRMLAPRASQSPHLLRLARDRLKSLQAVNHSAPPPPPPPPPRNVASQQTTQPVRRMQAPPQRSPLQASPVSQAKEDSQPQQMVDDETTITSPGPLFGEAATSISRITNGNNTLDSIDEEGTRSTLNFSYSPLSLKGLQLVDTSTPSKQVQGATSPSFQPKSNLGTISEKEVPATSPLHDFRLSQEIERLSRETVDLETARDKERTLFLKKLKHLQQVNQQQDDLVKSLEDKVLAADAQKQDMVQDLEKTQQERNDARRLLEEERSLLQQQEDKLRQVEHRMNNTIQDLNAALQAEKTRARLVIGAETKIRREKEVELSAQTQRNTDLNQLLRRTREHLEKVKQNHDTFKDQLLRAMGLSDKELRDLSQTEFAAELTRKIQQMRMKNEEMDVALRDARAAPKALEEERDRLDRRLKEVIQTNKILEEDNMSLSKKIEDLSNEVISSRALIDKLLRTSHETQESEWERKEAQYKSTIRNYQQQIRKQSTAVSLDLYKAAVEESKGKQERLESAEQKILALKSQLATLESPQVALKTPKENDMPAHPTGTYFFPADKPGQAAYSGDIHTGHRMVPHQAPVAQLNGQAAAPPPQPNGKGPRSSPNVRPIIPRHTPPQAVPQPVTGKDQRKTPTSVRQVESSFNEPPKKTTVSNPPSAPRMEGTNVSGLRVSTIGNAEQDRKVRSTKPQQENLQSEFCSEGQVFPKDREDLTGMWITFETMSPIKSPLGTPKVDQQVAYDYLMTNGGESPEHNENSPVLSPLHGPPLTWQQAFNMKSSTGSPRHTPKDKLTPSRRRLQKAREYGGRKGLKDQLEKMRSPPSARKGKRSILGNINVN
eukprot:Nitzschia sp. Nitz4//scaffold178_size73299//51595//54653//NITZ4_005713-RA/size73299-augustus-gene-0.86-mRNA-1//-1//CDS//3329539164//2837//frame0